ncbi:MAG: hypothetical protein PHR30_11210 [Gallionellaceae bacterium]|nr:hypothetical protein [Gallionellaceae bacterium]
MTMTLNVNVKPHNMQAPQFAALVIGAMFVSINVHASGGTGEYELDWPARGEILVYHSCGCADSCWVAEVRSVRPKTVRSRLRCDCEKLYFSHPGRSRERIVSDSCRGINESKNKPDAIRRNMERLLQP